MIDAEAIARAAYKLAYYLDRVETLKHTNPSPPEVRVMVPGFGPSTPGNTQAIDADYEIWVELRAWTHTLGLAQADTTKPPADAATADHARWVAMTARHVADNPDADAFLDDLERWVTIAQQVTGRESEPKSEPWQLAPVIIQAVERLGGHTTRRDLSDLAKHGYITSVSRMTRGGERNTYLLSEVINYLGKRSTPRTVSPRVL